MSGKSGLHPSTAPAADDPNAAAAPGLTGRWLSSLRLAWIVITVLALGIFLAGIPARYQQLLDAAAGNQPVMLDLGLSPNLYASYLIALDLILVLTPIAVASLIVWRKSDSPMAILVAITLVTTPLAAVGALETSAQPWRLLSDFILYIGLVASISLLYLFPDGRFVPRWTRPLAYIWAALNVPAVFASDSILSVATWPSLFQVIVLLAWSGSGVYAQLFRYFRESNPSQQRQTKWAIFGLAAAVLSPVGYYLPFITLPSLSQGSPPTVFYELADPALFQFVLVAQLLVLTIYTLVLLIFPFSFAVAILRYGLFDISIALNRTLVYGALTGIIVALYVVVVGGLSAILQVEGSPIIAVLATGLIAVLFQPLRAALQRTVNRLMYGERDDPAAVLSQLGRRLEKTEAPEATLSTIVETITQALRLPYAAIVLKEGNEFKIVSEAGSDQTVGPERGAAQRFPLTHQSELIGQLIVAPRPAEDAFSPAEQHLLRNIAGQAGSAVRAAQLAADLQRSRERLVSAREEERRRLRRDLHDDLGPQLATLTLKVDAARNLLHKDPVASDRMLLELKDQAQATIGDIRRLVNELQPAALDQLGLISALREHAASQNGLNRLHITVDAPETLPPLPAAVEVAAYRIATEAITNVVRHAQASKCLLSLSLDDKLHLQVRDNGRGLPVRYQAGVGLSSMRERAAELGGVCLIESPAGGGTLVTASLPLTLETYLGPESELT